MSDEKHQGTAVEELEQLGLREYEAKCFVSLTKIRSGTARDVSEHVDVPRTRVYEAVRSLESEGLVEIQHSSPQRFRAIPISEAVEVLEERYRSRIDSLERALQGIRQSPDEQNSDINPEVWSLAGRDTITTRTKRLVDEASAEVLLLIGDSAVLCDGLHRRIVAAQERGIDVLVGTGSEALRNQVGDGLPESVVFDSQLEWLHSTNGENSVSVGRLLLVDDTDLLASTVVRSNGQAREQAICGNGTSNSLVFTLRQLLSYRLRV
jgi:sugar-specific transcriptional regulator TrmB